MFDELFPFLFNNFSGNNFNGSLNNTNTNTNTNLNTNSYQYSSYNNGSQRVDIFSGSFIGTFSNIFNDVFTSLINNEELMNTIVETIVNNDTINSIIDFEEEEELKLEFRDYGDRYLIEGKIEVRAKEDIDVDYENDHISIKVKREALKNKDMAILMFDENKFIEKTFYVPKVDKSRIQAVYNANVLRIYLKKLPEIENGRQIIDVSDYIDE